MKTAIGVMARAPVPDRLDSRLLAAHDPKWVARLCAAMLRDTLDGLLSIDAERYVVFGAPLPGDADATAALEVLSRHVPAPWELAPQEGDDVGARLAAAFGRLGVGDRRALLVAADAPSFPSEWLEPAIASEEDDVLLGPSNDGTYLLLGLRAPAPKLFEGMPWKTPALLDATRAKITELGLRSRELEPWYRVDDPSDVLELIEELRRHPERAPRTAQFLVTNP